jgi:hypothetical protein
MSIHIINRNDLTQLYNIYTSSYIKIKTMYMKHLNSKAYTRQDGRIFFIYHRWFNYKINPIQMYIYTYI